jgi:hypothetical protein
MKALQKALRASKECFWPGTSRKVEGGSQSKNHDRAASLQTLQAAYGLESLIGSEWQELKLRPLKEAPYNGLRVPPVLIRTISDSFRPR